MFRKRGPPSSTTSKPRVPEASEDEEDEVIVLDRSKSKEGFLSLSSPAPIAASNEYTEESMREMKMALASSTSLGLVHAMGSNALLGGAERMGDRRYRTGAMGSDALLGEAERMGDGRFQKGTMESDASLGGAERMENGRFQKGMMGSDVFLGGAERMENGRFQKGMMGSDVLLGGAERMENGRFQTETMIEGTSMMMRTGTSLLKEDVPESDVMMTEAERMMEEEEEDLRFKTRMAMSEKPGSAFLRERVPESDVTLSGAEAERMMEEQGEEEFIPLNKKKSILMTTKSVVLTDTEDSSSSSSSFGEDEDERMESTTSAQIIVSQDLENLKSKLLARRDELRARIPTSDPEEAAQISKLHSQVIKNRAKRQHLEELKTYTRALISCLRAKTNDENWDDVSEEFASATAVAQRYSILVKDELLHEFAPRVLPQIDDLLKGMIYDGLDKVQLRQDISALLGEDVAERIV